MTLEDDLLALERRILVAVAGDFLAAVDELRRMLAAGASGVERRLLTLAIPAIEQAARAGVVQAWALGGAEALTAVADIRPPAVQAAAKRAVLDVPPRLGAPLVGLDGELRKARRATVALLKGGAGPEVAAAPIFQAATTIRSRVVTEIHTASNAAALEVGREAGAPMVWEAERDACVFCLALAGEVVEKAGEPFPDPGLYAPVPSSMVTKEAPPLHPHCRCRLAVLVARSYADGLKREAQRSILRGHSLASESHAVRIRAAARLLARNPVAPKSVKAYAAAAVKRGHFPTREVPEGDPRLRIN